MPGANPGAVARQLWVLVAALVALCFALMPFTASAQPATEPPVVAQPIATHPGDTPRRPKLGLVLSGGGAMGIAHVGVIQTLEKLGIRPDVVVGTSMGSIVGGLYASGMNGAELEQAVNTMNWDQIFDTAPPREGLTYRQKQLQSAFPMKVTVGVDGKTLLPPDSLVSDANLLLELRRLVGMRAAVPTFDQLPIPFRAVATDIETGHKVVIDRGELAGAMRASMSVPGVFAPYKMDGKLLLDGGMSDNVAIDVARDMGAEVLIVVATQAPLAKADKLTGLPAVLGQTVTLLILANERVQLATLTPNDVLIKVDTSPLTAGDFKKGRPLIAVGRKAAEAELASLQRLAAGREPAPPVSISRPPPRIDYVKVENGSRLADEMLLRRVEPFVGAPLQPEAVNTAMRDIYAMGLFSRVDYRIEQGADGRTGLVMHAEQQPGDAVRLRPGISLAATDERTAFDFSLELRVGQLDRRGSEARFVGSLGERNLVSAEYFKVLDSRQQWFIDPYVSLQKRPIGVFDRGGKRLGEYDAAYGTVQAALGRQFGTVGEVRLGVLRASGDAKRQEGLVTPRKVDLELGELYLTAAADRIDNPFFPSRGGAMQADWRIGLTDLGSDEDYQTVRLAGLYAFSFGRHAVILNAAGGDAIQGRLPLPALFNLGGPFSFPGFAVDELSGETFGVARLQYRYKLTDSSEKLFGLPLYAGVTVVTGNTWARHGDARWDDLRLGANVFVAADTLVGPVYVTLGHADGGRTAFYLFIGKPF